MRRWRVKKMTEFIFLDLFSAIFLPSFWRLIQSVEIPRAWLIEILIMHHHHCEIGHNIKLLWHPLTASWISESCLGEVWKKGNWIIKSIRRNKSSTWAAGKYVPQISPDSWKVLTSNFCWKFLISSFFLASASCGAKNRQGNTRPTAAKRVTKPGQKHQVRLYWRGSVVQKCDKLNYIVQNKTTWKTDRYHKDGKVAVLKNTQVMLKILVAFLIFL